MSVPLVVLDAKALILAYTFPGGPSSELLDRTIAREIRAVVSPAILAEFSRILSGPPFEVSAPLVAEWVADLRRICEPVEEPRELRVPRARLSREDSETVACAASAGARAIVTGDASRLLRMKSFRGIATLGPSAFLQSLTRLAAEA